MKKVKQETNFEKRTEVSQQRDNNNKIKAYWFKVYIQDSKPLTGVLSRLDMELIYRSYSAEGFNLQVRTIAREFPQYTLTDIKRIFRAFNITKAVSPIAPHLMEELNQDEIIKLTLNLKEKSYLKRLEEEKNKNNEKKVKELTLKNDELKKLLTKSKSLLKYKPLDLGHPEPITTDSSDVTMCIYLSDMHVGAHISNQSLYDLEYNVKIIQERLTKIINTAYNLLPTQIVVFNLGDSVDSFNRQTTRGGHDLPTVMSDKDMSKAYLDLMNWFFDELNRTVDYDCITYACVGESNHDGHVGWLNNLVLTTMLESKGVTCHLSDKSINHVEIDNRIFVYLHGKDNYNQFRNFPLTVNDKMENYFNEYLDYHKIYADKEVFIIKGDLHQSAQTGAKRFTYKSVPSLFGSSEWIESNFGNTKWGCDYSIMYSDESFIMHGTIK